MTFFNRVFNFKETDYKTTQDYLINILNIKNNTINNISCGTFYPTTFITPEYNTYSTGTVTLTNVYGDVSKYLCEYPNATFQVASQLNCLEMVHPSITPEHGISIYESDKTQGPICAIASPTATAYRNYIFKVNENINEYGQTKDRQLNLLNDFHSYLLSCCPSTKDKPIKLFDVVNGYLMFNNKEQLQFINNLLLTSPTLRREARSKIEVGVHREVGIVDYKCEQIMEKHRVNQIFCSGLPISYNTLSPILWLGLSELVLEAMYENTLLAAKNSSQPCFLTLIGGGTFGMNHSQIYRAIQRACNCLAMKGGSLDVRIIHYQKSAISEMYEKLPTKYPLLNYENNSVFDDINWINNILLMK